jgi:hypothetical protein
MLHLWRRHVTSHSTTTLPIKVILLLLIVFIVAAIPAVQHHHKKKMPSAQKREEEEKGMMLHLTGTSTTNTCDQLPHAFSPFSGVYQSSWLAACDQLPHPFQEAEHPCRLLKTRATIHIQRRMARIHFLIDSVSIILWFTLAVLQSLDAIYSANR